MSNYPIRHTYATPAQFKAYLNSTQASTWNQDDAQLLTLLEACSRRIDDHLGGLTVGPHVDTYEYDLGPGAAHTDALIYGKRRWIPSWDYNVMMSPVVSASVVALNDWLLNPTAVTAYQDTARSASSTLNITLTAPTFNNGDYWLEPMWENPKRFFRMNETSILLLYAGQATLEVAGIWGWQNVTHPLTTVNEGGGVGLTDTTIVATDSNVLLPGQTLLIDNEQMYVYATSGLATASVYRAVNGTAAAEHTQGTVVSVFEHPPRIIEACMDLARSAWRGRQLGTLSMVTDAQAGIQLPSPSSEQLAILKSLNNPFRQKSARLSRGIF